MNISLTKPQAARLCQALRLAIDYQEISIDSFRTDYTKSRNAYLEDRIIPKEWKHQAEVYKRGIKAFKKLLAMIRRAYFETGE